MTDRKDGMTRVQALIKQWMLEVESMPEFKTQDPAVVARIRKALVKIAWGSYKVGVLSNDSH